ncbi:hypothetical protein ACFQXA_25945 [Nocardiopsis composta]
MIDAIPHAWQVRLLGCGHIPMDDNPAAVADVILSTCRAAAPERVAAAA